MAVCPISVVIPTYRREQVLLDTLDYLLALEQRPAEILVVDQTQDHAEATEQRLQALAGDGGIRWLRLDQPSIPVAMNRGLIEAQCDVVLFLDDDIRPEPELVVAHLEAHSQTEGGIIVAGRVIQPWQEGVDFSADREFHFASLNGAWCSEFMEGNCSMRRDAALAVGGFDENFIGVAYRFGAEFAHRWLSSGRRIRYIPAACIHHLKVTAGGTRTYGEHLTTARPDHSVGAYYYMFRTMPVIPAMVASIGRVFRSIITRHHAKQPWWVPVTLMAEVRGLWSAARLLSAGPHYIQRKE